MGYGVCATDTRTIKGIKLGFFSCKGEWDGLNPVAVGGEIRPGSAEVGSTISSDGDTGCRSSTDDAAALRTDSLLT
ncbi:hypothetical protein GH714_002559 [Hevea brasiliensis]|uniref:Uncharacterized protein n=1 Tax=Hevea brasiliensis TaxID=3981 RepID=A0A6A6L8I6_HEVBR|nr:hypothetical protein GH714_002559 [Hevea brasiliensis]